jgi:hypothetical protein
LAYKGVTNDSYSITSGKITLISGKTNSDGRIFNGVGETIEVPRNEVDDNRNNGCSQGLHVGSLEYAAEFAGPVGKVLIVEVCPSDVVSVPLDCSCQKLRTSKYKVVGEYSGPLPDTYTSSYTSNDSVWDYDNDDNDYEVNDEVNGDLFKDDDDWSYDDEANDNSDDDSLTDYDRGYNDAKNDYNNGSYKQRNLSIYNIDYRNGYTEAWERFDLQ